MDGTSSTNIFFLLDLEEIQFEQIICVKQTRRGGGVSGEASGVRSNQSDDDGEKEPHFRRFVASKIVFLH